MSDFAACAECAACTRGWLIALIGERPELFPDPTLAKMEREAFQQALILTKGNRRQTAELLGISARILLQDPSLRIGRSGTAASPWLR